ncbi:MAG: protecting protein DprA protein [Candidatus Moranbacteria bacterium GW2011_GWE2_35_2-]|nr:MAG: protecting protein DprA protein [Candidatus Moranbacteria bacterium GW2011_GWE2_35_2-]KKQ21708.1 MAG: protecting protein DprA protein [Candidatus Moranbacteria bacterium GW2011_GWF2_37_11]KKQ28455.1 MAG: protecting protein DprA protein [Candidatus Moranbacteria bacterium GW2011_GWD1_37_17]KKQ31194.1 MAG: protecting protein DprA protein [Candidatus Moranbacteria bacterium GW2011_GWE1_37_24]KKQ46775.1 MAG: protecting protein DprA protein [Candidatus Moranbacteria bacterium GW2011_GWD2_37_
MKYLNALNLIDGVGSAKIKILLDCFSSGENIWKASFSDLSQSGIGEKLSAIIETKRKEIDPDVEFEKLKKENIRILDISNPDYPELLKEIHNPPQLLYVKGKKFSFNEKPMLAIVGSRKITPYGQQVAMSLARDLAQAGIMIVSGMALGVDAIAHHACLSAGEKTIAILGSGLDDKNIGPTANFTLSRRILEQGALVSDYPLGISAGIGTFPARNRIMAGMTIGTLVIEAAEKSGTLITANLALEFNREVFAVPGPIFSPTSTGANNLIKAGAKPVSSARDILEELNLEKRLAAQEVRKIIPSSPEEKIILEILSKETLHIDKIIKLSRMKTGSAISTLSIMEIKGMVKNIGGQNYILM